MSAVVPISPPPLRTLLANQTAGTGQKSSGGPLPPAGKYSLPRKGRPARLAPAAAKWRFFSDLPASRHGGDPLLQKGHSPHRRTRQRLAKKAAAPLSLQKSPGSSAWKKRQQGAAPPRRREMSYCPAKCPFPLASLTGAVQQAISVFAPSPPPGGHSSSAGKKREQLPPLSRWKPAHKKSVKTCGFQRKMKNLPLTCP